MNKSEIAARDNAAYIVESLALEAREETGRAPSREQLLEASAFIEGVMYRDYIGGRKTDAQTFRKIVQKAKTRLTGEYQSARFSESGERIKGNPRHREDPLYVKYLSLKSGEEPFMMQGSKYEYVWAEYPGGIKDIGVYSYANDLVYSYDSFRQMMNLDRTNPVRPRKGESSRDFVSRCMSEEKASFPEPKQRIAVCLSKSRKRNPVYDTGSDE